MMLSLWLVWHDPEWLMGSRVLSGNGMRVYGYVLCVCVCLLLDKAEFLMLIFLGRGQRDQHADTVFFVHSC